MMGLASLAVTTNYAIANGQMDILRALHIQFNGNCEHPILVPRWSGLFSPGGEPAISLAKRNTHDSMFEPRIEGQQS